MDKNDQQLLQLIYMFHSSAMQGLGKVADPTGKITRNLEYVSQTIDLMEMLLVKTKGNVSEDIEKMITQMISELKLNYVDEKSKLVVDKQEKETKGKKKKAAKKKTTKKKAAKKKTKK